ncbi:hypothetical protein BH23ACT11_BH23ACT11_28610 [soil metagenome]
MSRVIGVPEEIKGQEGRVSMQPDGINELVHHGHEVVVETQAGAGAGFSDEEYEHAGARILDGPDEVFEIGYFAATLFVSSWGPLAFLSVYSKRLTRRGAIAGMSVSFGTVFVLQALITFTNFPAPPIYLHPVIIGFVAGLVAFWVGSLGHQPDEESLKFQRSLFEKPSEELKPAQIKSTFRYAYVTFAACVVVIVFLFLVYYLPFSQTIAGDP